jgi:hypothetical protein
MSSSLNVIKVEKDKFKMSILKISFGENEHVKM